MDDSETQFYALDGQHRLMAIRGLHDLITNNHLPSLDENGKPRRSGGLSRDGIINDMHKATGESTDSIHERLQNIMSERVGIEIIPAVRKGETYPEALQRLRQMFVDVNENAKPLTTSQITQLDEATGYRIIARNLCTKHELFKVSVTTTWERRTKVDETKTQLPETPDCFTTLNKLAEISKRYLKENQTLPEREIYVSWDNLIAKGVSIRPTDHALQV